MSSKPNPFSFFPPLDTCLTGETRLISWRAAYRALCDEEAAIGNSDIERFLNHSDTIVLLSNALEPSQAPSAKSGSELDTKTAPINVSQAQTGDYNLDQIKDDAKWLSAELQIEELAALRVAVIEWQERPADQLLNTIGNGTNTLLDTPDATSSMLSNSALDLSSSVAALSKSALDFANEEVRQQRLLDIYLSEQNHLLRLSADLVSRCAVTKPDIQGQPTGAFRELSSRSWVDEVAAKVADNTCPSTQAKTCEAFISRAINQLSTTLARTQDSNSWPKAFANEAKAPAYVDGLYTEIVCTLRLLLAALYAYDGIPTTAMVQSWFNLMQKHTYLHSGTRFLANVDITIPQLLISIISVDILKLQLSVGEIVSAAGVDAPALKESHYINDEECLAKLNINFNRIARLEIALAAPVLLAWSIIMAVIRDIALVHRDVRESRVGRTDEDIDGLGRRSSRRVSIDLESPFEKLYSMLQSPELEEYREDPGRRFAIAAVDTLRVFSFIGSLSATINSSYSSSAESGTAFSCKEILLDLTREGLPFVQYDAEILEAVLSFLTPVEHSLVSQQQVGVLADKFLSDHDQLKPFVLDQALRRYPHELTPMLRLCTALSRAESRFRRPQGQPEIAEILQHLQVFTLETPTQFRSYHLENEDENMNEMILTEPLAIFTTQSLLGQNRGQRLLTSGEGDDVNTLAELDVPAGTTGIITREQRPLILTLNHTHCGLDFLSTLLSTFLPSSEMVLATQRTSLDRITAADIVALFTALLASALKQENGGVVAQELLDSLSKALRYSQDIVAVIADIFEMELLAHLDQVAQEGSLELATACAEFFGVVAKFSPERVWSFLSTSSLLGVIDGAPSLASVVAGTEVQLGTYRFLGACVELHSILLDDAISGLVKRKSQLQKSRSSRFGGDENVADTTPERTMSTVINAFQKILLEAFLTFPEWTFANTQQRFSITTRIMDSFTKLLLSTYGVDLAKKPSKRLTCVLAPAAHSLLTICAPESGNSPLTKTCSRIFSGSLSVVHDNVPIQLRRLLLDYTNAAFGFLAVLIRTVRSGINLLATKEHMKINKGQDNSAAAKRAFSVAGGIFKSMPVLASLLASEHAFKHDLFELLSELIQAVGAVEEDPPSMLAQLSPDAAKSFLQVITQLDRPIRDVKVERRVWDFLSTIMGSKQQWFAIYLLTGKLPKSRSHRREDEAIKGKSVFSYALDQLAKISLLPPERALGMLRFLAVSQQTWVWATNELRSHTEFLKNNLAWMETLNVPSRNSSPTESIISANEYEMASYLCEILAINLHASIEVGDKTVLKILIPKLAFLREHGVAVNAYNRSLHKNLELNLKKAFPQSDLGDFRRTTVNPETFGLDYYYDREIAGDILGHSKSWNGQSDQGFDNEFARANANFSLLHAQTALLKSWKTLATTLCECADTEPALQIELANIAKECLLANASPQIDEPGVADILQQRIELAFVLVSKLVALQVQDESMKSLLMAAWELVSTSPVDYDVATVPDDVRYYRQLLQVLYLTIQPHSYVVKTTSAMQFLQPQVASSLVAIVGKVITPGFRALCGNLHNDLELALPADFALLTALLQAILAVPGVTSVQILLSDIVTGSSVIRGALSLYSWADQLADDVTRDPIYGEIAIMFLLALSTVRPIAEQMALEGVLTQLSSGNLSNYLRKPNGKGPFDEPHRMFTIWTEGFLPLCLNLLDSVGPAIAAEVALFLNSFPEQLRRAEMSLQNEVPNARNPTAGAVTLSLVSEAHSLAMIALILDSDMARGAAEGINAADIPTLEYDVEGVKNLAESLSRGKRTLNDRIMPISPLEERWAKTPVAGTGDNQLSQKVMGELLSMLSCFPPPES